ncbi:MAG: magnesium transporter CorA family protein [Deltaproteobacteria bacterium]|nr:magnesium transporter CorA family protein [Deltaproteobacteria bacterium]
MIRYYKIESGKIVESSTPGPAAVYVAPTEAESKELIEVHKIDPHNLQSALDPDEIGRFEVEDDHIALILKRPCNYSSKDNFLFRVMSAGVFLFKEKLIVVLASDIGLFEGKQAIRTANLQDALLRMIYVIINHFMGHLKVINMLSDSLEQKVNTSIENKHLLNMFTLEKSLVYFLSAINDNSSVISKLKSNAAKIGFTPENLELLEDIIIDNLQCLTLAQTYSSILSGLMDARASLVSNNLNVMMKNLNAIVIAVAVPSFFAGVGGMSEFSTLLGGNHLAFGYPLFLGAMAGLGIAVYFLIKRLENN